LNFDRAQSRRDVALQSFAIDNVSAFDRYDLTSGNVGFGK